MADEDRGHRLRPIAFAVASPRRGAALAGGAATDSRSTRRVGVKTISCVGCRRSASGASRARPSPAPSRGTGSCTVVSVGLRQRRRGRGRRCRRPTRRRGTRRPASRRPAIRPSAIRSLSATMPVGARVAGAAICSAVARPTSAITESPYSLSGAAVEHLRAAAQAGGLGGGVKAVDLVAAAHRHAGDGGEGEPAVALRRSGAASPGAPPRSCRASRGRRASACPASRRGRS